MNPLAVTGYYTKFAASVDMLRNESAPAEPRDSVGVCQLPNVQGRRPCLTPLFRLFTSSIRRLHFFLTRGLTVSLCGQTLIGMERVIQMLVNQRRLVLPMRYRPQTQTAPNFLGCLGRPASPVLVSLRWILLGSAVSAVLACFATRGGRAPNCYGFPNFLTQQLLPMLHISASHRRIE